MKATINEVIEEIVEVLKMAKDAEFIHETDKIHSYISFIRKMGQVISEDTQTLSDVQEELDECRTLLEELLDYGIDKSADLLRQKVRDYLNEH